MLIYMDIDANNYFLKHKFILTQDVIEFCNNYSKFTKDIVEVTWDAQRKFREKKKRILNLNYKNK